MTQPPTDRRFARDVAKQVDRRRVRRRVTVWSALLALVAAGAAYLRCGSGFGLGGLGGRGGFGGDDGERAPREAVRVSRCAIRITAARITVDGKPRSRDDAIAACKTAPGVDIYLSGDARHGDGRELGEALAAAGARNVEIHEPPVPVAPPAR